MKKTLCLLMMIIFAFALGHGQEFGSIRGKVLDKEGAPLPGATVTLTGSKTAPRSVVSSAEGNFRFLNLPVASDYTLKVELPGFNTVVREKLVVSFGRDVSLDIILEQATIEEQVTVIGQTPVIDTKKTQVGVNITSEMIMQLPTARNPWVLMKLAPGMLIDREDVGGSDAGQQSAYFGHGSSSGDSTWNIDGGNITDNSALGAAPAYLNMAGYEEIQINYGNNDIKAQTGGVQLNFITKRGGNAFSGTFFLDSAKAAWQSKNIPSDLEARGYKGAGIRKIYNYGANFGGPIIKDRAWFFGSYGIQDLGTNTLAGTKDDTWLESGYFRLDFQLTSNTRMNLFYEYDNKQKWGRTAWGATMQAPETVWNQKGPTPIYKAEIEHMFGNLFLNAKVVYTHNTFNLEPYLGKRTSDGSGPYQVWTYYPDFYVSGNIDDYGTVRPQTNVNFFGNYFAENLLGGDHEIKFGVDYVHSTVSSYDLYEGNLIIAKFEPDWVEAWIIRDWKINQSFNRYSIYAQDTATFGRLTFSLGLRYDIEKSIVANEVQPAAPLMSNYLREMRIDKLDPGLRSKILSPRFSIIYDISGDGKNVIKLNLARYGSQTGYEFASFLNPAPWAEIDLRWVDLNGDGRVTQNELFGTDWDTGLPTVNPNDPNGWSWYSGFDPADPGKAESTNRYDPNYKTPLLDEISLSFEREIATDFAGRIELFYKKRHRFAWDIGIMADGSLETKDNWYKQGTEPVTGSDYYARRQRPIGSYRTNANKAYERYLAFEIVLKKRLSHRWMLDGSFTFMDWRYFHNGDFDWDLTNYDFYEGGVIAPQSGGSGITNVYVNSRWMFKLTGLYQFPYGINGSFALLTREGYVYPPFVQVYRSNVGWTNIYATEAGKIGKFGDNRLPNFYELNLRVEKRFDLSEKMKIAVALDCFNALNANTALSVEARLTSPNYKLTKRILNPRVFRFGIRFDF